MATAPLIVVLSLIRQCFGGLLPAHILSIASSERIARNIYMIADLLFFFILKTLDVSAIAEKDDLSICIHLSETLYLL